MITSALLAYIDPGSGGLLVQVLLASLLTLGVCFRRILYAPVRFFLRPGPEAPSESCAADEVASENQS